MVAVFAVAVVWPVLLPEVVLILVVLVVAVPIAAVLVSVSVGFHAESF